MAVTPAAPIAPATRDVDMMADVAEVNEQIGEVRERVARIEGQLSHLATTTDLRQQVAEVKEQIAQIKSQLPHLATKAVLQEQIAEVKDQAAEIRAQVAQIEGQLPHLATKADLADATTRLERAVRRQTYWLVGTMIAVGGLIFAAIKLL